MSVRRVTVRRREPLPDRPGAAARAPARDLSDKTSQFQAEFSCPGLDCQVQARQDAAPRFAVANMPTWRSRLAG